MDDILRKLNLGTLVDRFNDEKVEVDTVISASDSELARLGVCTIGDRIRLRNLCKATKQEDSEVSHASTSEPIWEVDKANCIWYLYRNPFLRDPLH